MIHYKTSEEIEILRENAILVSKTLAEVGKHVAPGVTTRQLDKIAETFIRDHGAVPGFLGYGGFPATLCLSVNDMVVHGIPDGYVLQEGDIISVDCGTVYKGFYGDSAYTFPVGEVDAETALLLKTTEESLRLGAEKAVEGNRIGDIGYAIQSYCEARGFSVVRELVGHGLGRDMHEDPLVPNYGKPGSGKKLREGMVICIEPMINAGAKEVYEKKDGWGVATADGKKSAHFEFAVAVRKGKPDILTTFDYIYKIKEY
ncbi:MAG: type I methionyl aminopeptidase [Bacteroidales bacterium]|nr:type I methionyl aminopeptidase [Bacteroidales bacterium]